MIRMLTKENHLSMTEEKISVGMLQLCWKNFRTVKVGSAMIAFLPILGACSTLPSNGPTMSRIYGQAEQNGIEHYQIRDIDSSTVDQLNATVAATEIATEDFSTLGPPSPIGVISPGDILQISIYEIGISLFSGPSTMGAPGMASPDYTSHNEKFVNVPVDQDGSITLPYIGSVNLAGSTVAQAQRLIEQGLAGKSQRPQVLVTISDSPMNSVYVVGTVRRPGKILLSSMSDRLLNVLLAAGGSADQPSDTVVRIVRSQQSRSMRLNMLDVTDKSNILVGAGDYIEVSKRAQTFTVMGATNRVAQVPFESDRISLAEAIAKSGGVSDALADPRAVFLFRNAKPEEGQQEPIVYKLNLMDPKSYFISQNIYLHDRDLIYVANARANVPAKFIAIMNQLFSPIVTYRAITQ